MSTPTTILQAALASGATERKLLAPLICAVAGEVEGLAPQAFLRNATKLANTLRDLQRGLNLDVVVPESGSCIELEALGATLDWNSYPPKLVSPIRSASVPSDVERRGRLPMLTDTITRLKTVLGDRAAIGVALSGPQKLVSASDGHISLSDAAELVLTMVRLICSKGVNLIWLLEDSSNPPSDLEEWQLATAPILGTIRFYQAVPALHLPGNAEGWLPIVQELGSSAITCVDPEKSPGLATAVSNAGLFGVIVDSELTEITPSLRQFIGSHGCMLITSDADWSGRIPAREMGNKIELLKGLI